MKGINKYIKVLIVIALILVLYDVACRIYDKSFINDVKYIRLINSINRVTGNCFSYEKCMFYKDEDGKDIFVLCFKDVSWRRENNYEMAAKELKDIAVAFDTFLIENPNYFPQGCKIEIRTEHSYVRTLLLNHMNGVIYDGFIKLLIFEPYELVDVADNFKEIKYLYYPNRLDESEVEMLKKFTCLETLALGYGDDEVLNEIKRRYPILKIRKGYDY